ncbi:MAG TPA: primosomal protein N' [Candidatus Saccharimonadia bacterium]|jgi:primosomal protein N' (replication factor Y)|nr:primosomal protein N' [Candidatus Saccharimonadia bacterium]
MMVETLRYYLISPLAYTGSAGVLTYHHPDALAPGQIVQITVGRRALLGVVTGPSDRPAFVTKPVAAVLDLAPLPAELCDLAAWVGSYYAASPSSVWTTMLPAGLTKTRRRSESPVAVSGRGLPTTPLTPGQTAAIERLARGRSPFLLQGVTGSGKTRVYLEQAERALTAGRSIIVLVPEITLTSQIVGQFEEVFGDQVLASHSKLTEAQRHRIWTQAHESAVAGRPRIIVGPRSCLFMPVHNLGLIVVDECHEPSYKQEQNPRYHAVAVAAKRATLNNALLILGSATPGLGELYLSQQGRLEHIMMSQRANNISQTQAKIIDLRNKDVFKLSKFITQELHQAVSDTLAQGRQSLLYLNRRGSASSQVCGDCGHVTVCPNCSLPLTFHADLMKLICHHCNFRTPAAAVCPECGGHNLRLIGGGTKRIESEIEQLFPSARIARLDRDSATLSHVKEVFTGLHKGTIDILVGTQMVAKGLDLPAIDTIGVVSADTMLHLPDFSASERTFQLLSQVSGRAGRGDRPGQVLIQTYTPTHPAIVAAAASDYAGFAEAELAERRALGYPPYAYLLKITVAAGTSEGTRREAATFANTLASRPGLAITGPAPAFIERTGNKYHWIITVRSKQRALLVDVANGLPSPQWAADLDPMDLL